MMAIAVLGTLFLYGWLSFGVVWLVVRWAKKRGRSPTRWGIVAGLVMYHLVFWDFLPTLIVYKYYCATKAGFWVYKTPEQWKAENPGVAETLTWRERSSSFEEPDGAWGELLNERFIEKNIKKEIAILPIAVFNRSIVDKNTGEIVVKRISVGTGYYDGSELLRFWANFGSFSPGSREFSNFVNEYKKLGGEIK